MMEVAKLIYRRTPQGEYGDRKLYEEVLQMPVEWTRTFINSLNWRIYWEKRKYKNAEYGYVIVHKRPLEPGNVWEETLLFEGGKILPDDAYE